MRSPNYFYFIIILKFKLKYDNSYANCQKKPKRVSNCCLLSRDVNIVLDFSLLFVVLLLLLLLLSLSGHIPNTFPCFPVLKKNLFFVSRFKNEKERTNCFHGEKICVEDEHIHGKTKYCNKLLHWANSFKILPHFLPFSPFFHKKVQFVTMLLLFLLIIGFTAYFILKRDPAFYDINLDYKKLSMHLFI